MRRPLVAGNWKMNGTRETAIALARDVARGAARSEGVDVAVCPPFVHLEAVIAAIGGAPVGVGAQNVCSEESGAFTGEVSAAMLAEVGCRYVVVGHSERRTLYGETSEVVATKLRRVLDGSMIPVLCVGETLAERESGATEGVVAAQLDAALDAVGADGLARAVLAYEPVWAIGTGHTATPEQAQEVHAFLRGRVSERDRGVAAHLRILYGGSMKADNAADLLAREDIDGGLVGGASLKADEFLEICGSASG